MKFEKKISYKQILASLLLIIYPISSLPLIVAEMTNRKRYAYLLLSLFMALLGYLMVPLIEDDLVQHYETFYRLETSSFDDFNNHLDENIDFLMYLFFFTLGKLSLPKELIPFTSVFIGYYLKFKIFNDWESKTTLPQKIFLIFLAITFLSIPFRNFSLHIRNFVALAFMSYGVYQLFINDKTRGWFYIAIAPIIHLMTLAILPLVLLAKYVKKDRIYRIAFIVSFSFILLPTQYLTSKILGIDTENERLAKKQAVYADGYYVQDYIEDMSLKGKIATEIGKLPLYLCFFYLLFFNKESRLRNLVYLSAIFTNIFFNLPMFYGRYAYATNTLFYILLLHDYANVSVKNTSKKGTAFIQIFAFVMVIVFLSSMYATRKQIMASHPQLLYQSYIAALLNSVEKEDYIRR